MKTRLNKPVLKKTGKATNLNKTSLGNKVDFDLKERDREILIPLLRESKVAILPFRPNSALLLLLRIIIMIINIIDRQISGYSFAL